MEVVAVYGRAGAVECCPGEGACRVAGAGPMRCEVSCPSSVAETPTAAVPTAPSAASLTASAPAPPAVEPAGTALLPEMMARRRRYGSVTSKTTRPPVIGGPRPTELEHAAPPRRSLLRAPRPSHHTTTLR